MTTMDPSSRIDSPSAALAAILDLLAAPRPWDLPATSRQLRKLLKAVQHSLQQVSLLHLSSSTFSLIFPIKTLTNFQPPQRQHFIFLLFFCRIELQRLQTHGLSPAFNLYFISDGTWKNTKNNYKNQHHHRLLQ
jgi:hypothetical protein